MWVGFVDILQESLVISQLSFALRQKLLHNAFTVITSADDFVVYLCNIPGILRVYKTIYKKVLPDHKKNIITCNSLAVSGKNISIKY